MVGKVMQRLFALLWGMVLVVALWAPWPYAIATALFAIFVQFSALDERDELVDAKAGQGAKR